MLINLREFYPFYLCDTVIEVSDEIGAVLLESKREEKNYITGFLTIKPIIRLTGATA